MMGSSARLPATINILRSVQVTASLGRCIVQHGACPMQLDY